MVAFGVFEEVRAVVELFLTENRFALLWTRLFMVGAERPEVFGDLLWELATKEQVLLSRDLRKDAVDLIAAVYPSQRRPNGKILKTRYCKRISRCLCNRNVREVTPSHCCFRRSEKSIL